MNHDQYQTRDERSAIALVERMGVDEAGRHLEAIHLRGAERYEYFAKKTGVPYGWTSLDYLSDDEKYERHLLTLGLTLCTDPQAKARARILARREERRKARELVKHALGI